jgi:hypothetical protein
MGYATTYELTVGPFDTEDEAEFFEFKIQKQIKDIEFGSSVGPNLGRGHFVTLETDKIKWYEWRSDLLQLSSKFPAVTIDVEGDGEESGDMWKARFRNGEFEKVKVKFTFPDFENLVD